MEEQPSFITQGYFDMLARSLPGSNETSAPPSPRRRIAQPVRSRLHPLSAASTVPPAPNAEFVASAPAPLSQAHGISETAFSPNYFEKFFVEERELGRGGRGVVLLVKHVLDGVTLGRFACKRVPIGDDHAWLEKVLVEVQLLQTLSHQNLVSYRHVWLEDFQISKFGPSVPCAFILQQYCNGGDMQNYVLGSAQASTSTQELKERIRRKSRGESELPRRANEPNRLHFDEIYNFFRDITSGLRHLHHNGFIHRDLKPSNCLLHTVGGETRVLVSDFGEVQYEYATRKSTGATGTISYCAPEVLRRISPGGPFENFTSKSDIFSLGMILHFLCFANLPYTAANVLHEEREDIDALRQEITTWGGFDDQRKLRPELPAALYAFLKRLLSLEPDQRPSADDVLQVVSSGRLDDIPAARRRSSMEPEELTPGRRIQKLDTPQKGKSPQGRPGQDGGLRSKRQKFMNMRSRSQERKRTEMTPNDNGVTSDSEAEEENAMLNGSPSNMRDRGNLKLNSTMILRGGKRNSISLPTSPLQKSAAQSPVRRQLLLEHVQLYDSPPSSLVRGRIRAVLNMPVTSTSRIAILTLKLISTLQPCLSQGINALIVYAIMAIALLEFSVSDLRVWKAGLAALLHVVVLTVAWRTDRLCRSPTDGWVLFDEE
jgi:serine/threonine protein kinase